MRSSATYAGRLVLVNSVLNSMQIYWASIFILPKPITHKVKQICRDFLWNGLNDKNRIPLVAWDKMCQPKSKGDLNIKCCETWNTAAICKQVWNIASKKDTLWVKWISSVYLKGGDFWSHTPKPDSTWCWRKLNKLKSRIQQFIDRDSWALTSKGTFSMSSCTF